MYVVNRSEASAEETTISLNDGRFSGKVTAFVVNGRSVESANTVESPHEVGTREAALQASGSSFTCSFEPHSLTALIFSLG